MNGQGDVAKIDGECQYTRSEQDSLEDWRHGRETRFLLLNFIFSLVLSLSFGSSFGVGKESRTRSPTGKAEVEFSGFSGDLRGGPRFFLHRGGGEGKEPLGDRAGKRILMEESKQPRV